MTEALPTGPGWLFEPKWDGYRAIVTLRGGQATLTSRNGNDLTERFREVARAVVHAVRTPSAVLDAEVCALDESGTARFESLQAGSGRLVLMVFDLLVLDDEPVYMRPLTERRRLLEGVIDPTSDTVRVSPAFEDGPALLEAASAQGLEGVIAKRADAPYRPGRRTPEWQKLKLRLEDDFRSSGSRAGPADARSSGALVLGRSEADGLHWAGNVGSGLGDGDVESLLAALRPHIRSASPLVETPRMPRVRASDVTWVEPVLAAQVTFAERTREGRPAPPSSSGCATMSPVERPPTPSEIHRGRRTLRLSNLDKPFWPDEGITRASFLTYYRDVARCSLPSAQAAVHDEALSGRLAGQELLPEAGALHIPEWIETAPSRPRRGRARSA